MLMPAVKFTAVVFNTGCMFFSIGFVVISSVGLQNSKPNTDEHTYFIVGIILGTFVFMTTLFGLYGLINKLLGLLLIYAFFLITLLLIQYLEMHTFQPYSFRETALQNLEYAWNQITVKPKLMATIEDQFECCGLEGSRNYHNMNLTIPLSCYVNHNNTSAVNLHAYGCHQEIMLYYQGVMERDCFYNWALIILEAIVSILTLVLCIHLFRRLNEQQNEAISGYIERPFQIRQRENHINSHTNLLVDE